MGFDFVADHFSPSLNGTAHRHFSSRRKTLLFARVDCKTEELDKNVQIIITSASMSTLRDDNFDSTGEFRFFVWLFRASESPPASVPPYDPYRFTTTSARRARARACISRRIWKRENENILFVCHWLSDCCLLLLANSERIVLFVFLLLVRSSFPLSQRIKSPFIRIFSTQVDGKCLFKNFETRKTNVNYHLVIARSNDDAGGL